jgi:hypothetical protein
MRAIYLDFRPAMKIRGAAAMIEKHERPRPCKSSFCIVAEPVAVRAATASERREAVGKCGRSED